MAEYLIAHDLGTSGDKATLFEVSGKLVRSCTASYDVDFFGDNCAEQNPEDWWQAVCSATREIVKDIPADSIKGISFSAQMQGCLVVDKEGKPLRKAIIWADQRAVQESKLLAQTVGEDRMYEITGHRVSASYSLEKLMWLKKHEPDIYQKTYKMLQAKEYIIFKLTGNFVTEYSDASGTNALDLEKMEWSQEILEAAGIEAAIFPELKRSIDIAGRVTKEAGRACGLAEGVPVVCGGGDGPCSTVGAGCIGDDETFVTFGTSAWIGATTKEKFIDEDKVLFCFAHVIPDRYMPCGTMQAAGSSYAYIRKALCSLECEKAVEEGRSPYEVMNQMVKNSPVGAKGLLFLPYLLGERSPRWNPDTSGSFLGIKMCHEKADYVRAVLEGVAMNLELILKAYRKYMKIEHMILTGGGAKGNVVCEILSDVMDVILHTPSNVEEATSIGAAVIAGVGVGIYSDFSEVKRFLQFEQTYQPAPEHVAVYDERKPVFDKAYYCLEELYGTMTV